MLFFLIIIKGIVGELIYFVEVARHGARSPSDYMEWDIGRWPEGEENVTPEGLRQHYLIGVQLRNRYIIENSLLPSNFNSSLLYLVSSTAERAQKSLQSQLLGLYPDTDQILHVKPNPPIQLSFSYEIDSLPYVPAFPFQMFEIDPMIHSKDTCENYEKYIKKRKKSQSMKKIIADYEDIISVIEKKYNISRDDAEDLVFDIVGSIRSNKFAGYSWDPVFDEAFLERAQELYMKRKIFTSYEPDYVARFVGSDFFNDVIGQFDLVKNGKMVRKGSIYSAHDTTLFSIFATLGMNLKVQPSFASIILFEILKENEEFFIRVIYNGKELVLPNCETSKCKLSTFVEYMSTRVFRDTQKACENIGKLEIESVSLIEFQQSSYEFNIFHISILLAEIGIIGLLFYKKNRR